MLIVALTKGNTQIHEAEVAMRKIDTDKSGFIDEKGTICTATTIAVVVVVCISDILENSQSL